VGWNLVFVDNLFVGDKPFSGSHTINDKLMPYVTGKLDRDASQDDGAIHDFLRPWGRVWPENSTNCPDEGRWLLRLNCAATRTARVPEKLSLATAVRLRGLLCGIEATDSVHTKGTNVRSFCARLLSFLSFMSFMLLSFVAAAFHWTAAPTSKGLYFATVW